MHETKFPASKAATTHELTPKNRDECILLRLISCRAWIALWLSVIVCSCVKLPRRPISTNANNATLSAVKLTAQVKRVNLNTAAAADLEALPGVGKILAERIVTHRERYGSFRRVEHLMMVRGFSDSKFRAIRDFLTVE